ncbi:MAG: family 43 glycosylhydrolase [Prevotellaceae bacterium]|nr:family 43 glycosylhydrolase [Prevotellaceae bacterium]
MNKLPLILALTLLPLAALAQPFGRREPPQWRTDDGTPFVHDPVMARGEDGKYYVFCTGMGVQVLSSPDLKEWSREPSVFTQAPEWAEQMIRGYRGHTWAPDISRHDGLWYLYYSCSTFGKNESAIGLAVNKTLDPTADDYGWQDRGLVIASRRHKDCWNAIDPNLALDEEGQPYLVFGSFWDGIQLVRLSQEDLQTPLTEPRTIARRWNHAYTIEEVDNPQNFEIEGEDTIEAADNAIEAPFIIHRGEYYYLFVSQDYCCRGRRSTYRTVYGRSESIEGPYLDKEGTRMDEGGGTLLYGPDEQYYGIGHSAAYELDGQWLFLCHAYDKDTNGKAVLFLRTLSFDPQGWIVTER